VKVVLCLPSRGTPKAGFTYDLMRLTQHVAKNLPHVDLGIIRGSGTLIHDLRRDLVRDALATGADWIFFLDDDMRFPPDTLDCLLRHRRDIVGANYVTRQIPPRPTAKRTSEDGMQWFDVPTRPIDTGLEEVDGLGFGAVLINARVFKDLPQPWFSMPWAPHHDHHVGEDIYFCTVAGAAGHPSFIDHDLSKVIRHVGEFEFSWDHYEATHDFNEPPRSD
jgi:hypothetical protein